VREKSRFSRYDFYFQTYVQSGIYLTDDISFNDSFRKMLALIEKNFFIKKIRN
jgi:hypothetical protein